MKISFDIICTFVTITQNQRANIRDNPPLQVIVSSSLAVEMTLTVTSTLHPSHHLYHITHNHHCLTQNLNLCTHKNTTKHSQTQQTKYLRLLARV